MSERSATQRPWSLSECSNGGALVVRGNYSTQIFPRADAEFIVKAVNAHDDLVAALQAALAYIPGSEVRSWPPGHKLKLEALDKLRVALAKAGVR